MHDVPILEIYSGQCAAHLGAQFDLVDRGKLPKEAQPRIKLVHERLAHRDLRKSGLGAGRSGACATRMERPSNPDGDDRYCGAYPKFDLRSSSHALRATLRYSTSLWLRLHVHSVYLLNICCPSG